MNAADHSKSKTCRKKPAVSDLSLLYVVTMTTASIPWRRCVFRHGNEEEWVALELKQQHASPFPPGPAGDVWPCMFGPERSLILSSPLRGKHTGCHPGARRPGARCPWAWRPAARRPAARRPAARRPAAGRPAARHQKTQSSIRVSGFLLHLSPVIYIYFLQNGCQPPLPFIHQPSPPASTRISRRRVGGF